MLRFDTPFLGRDAQIRKDMKSICALIKKRSADTSDDTAARREASRFLMWLTGEYNNGSNTRNWEVRLFSESITHRQWVQSHPDLQEFMTRIDSIILQRRR